MSLNGPSENPIIMTSFQKNYTDEMDRAVAHKNHCRDFGGDVWDIARPVKTTDGEKVDEQMANKADVEKENGYKAECAVIPKSALTNEFLTKAESLQRDLEEFYKEGMVYCFAAVPFNGASFDKTQMQKVGSWEKFLKDGLFLKRLRIVPNAGNLSHDIDHNLIGFFFELFPKRIQKDVSEGGCSFEIKWPNEAGHPQNKIWFAEQQKKAYKNLQTFLSEPLKVV